MWHQSKLVYKCTRVKSLHVISKFYSHKVCIKIGHKQSIFEVDQLSMSHIIHSHQKLIAKFLFSTVSGNDCTSCHQKAGMNSTSPRLNTHSTRWASTKFGNLSKSGSRMSTGDMTMEVLSNRNLRVKIFDDGLKDSMASGMCAS